MALEVGKWSFEKADEYCYIGSLATETDLPSDKKRGDFYVLVYKNIGNPTTNHVSLDPKRKTLPKLR